MSIKSIFKGIPYLEKRIISKLNGRGMGMTNRNNSYSLLQLCPK
jgi:hypothetical protein